MCSGCCCTTSSSSPAWSRSAWRWSYLTQPPRRGAPRAACPGTTGCWRRRASSLGVYIAVRFPALSEDMTSRPIDGLIVAFITIPLVIEALRRTRRLGARHRRPGLPGLRAARPIRAGRARRPAGQRAAARLLSGLGSGQHARPADGGGGDHRDRLRVLRQLLFASGGSAFFTDIALALMGRYRGGSAKIAVTASCLFGMISGSAVSNVASVGVLTIPLMRQGGYPAHVAAAIEAVASTGGQLMPPVMGAAAFLMAEFLQVPYRDVVIAAALPALLYYFALFIQADLLAARSRHASDRHAGRAAAAAGAQAGLALPAAVRRADLRPVLAQLVAGTGGARRLRRAGRHRLDARLRRQAAASSATSSTPCAPPAWPRSTC